MFKIIKKIIIEIDLKVLIFKKIFPKFKVDMILKAKNAKLLDIFSNIKMSMYCHNKIIIYKILILTFMILIDNIINRLLHFNRNKSIKYRHKIM